MPFPLTVMKYFSICRESVLERKEDRGERADIDDRWRPGMMR